MTASASSIKLTNIAAAAAADKLGENLVALDVSDRMPFADVFLLVSGRNERQVASISDEIEEKLLAAGTKCLRKTGKENGQWILLEFGDLICHVMLEESRMFYSLESLWKDCPVVRLEVS